MDMEKKARLEKAGARLGDVELLMIGGESERIIKEAQEAISAVIMALRESCNTDPKVEYEIINLHPEELTDTIRDAMNKLADQGFVLCETVPGVRGVPTLLIFSRRHNKAPKEAYTYVHA